MKLVLIIILLVIILVTITCQLPDDPPCITGNSDTNTYGNYPIQVRPSHISGLGVFATREILKDDIIEECPCLEDDKKKFGGLLQNYICRSVDVQKSALPLGYGAIYNHSDKNNAKFEIVKTGKNAVKMVITAVSPIGKDEEILINYGPGYWNSRSRFLKKI